MATIADLGCLTCSHHPRTHCRRVFSALGTAPSEGCHGDDGRCPCDGYVPDPQPRIAVTADASPAVQDITLMKQTLRDHDSGPIFPPSRAVPATYYLAPTCTAGQHVCGATNTSKGGCCVDAHCARHGCTQERCYCVGAKDGR